MSSVPPQPRRLDRRATAAVAVAVAAGLSLAACGIPTSGAKPIAKADVPFHLLDPTTSSTTAPGPPAVGVDETVFLVAPDGQHLIPVTRVLGIASASLSDVVGALLAGPTSGEQAAGISSFVSGNRNQVSASVAGGIATVNFSVNPVQPSAGPDQTLGVAQVVYTVTQQPGITQVLIHLGGQAAEVPVASGAEMTGPVNRFDYLPQAPVS